MRASWPGSWPSWWSRAANPASSASSTASAAGGVGRSCWSLAAVLVAELVVAQSLGQFGGVGGLDEVQVVDPGRRGGWGVDVGAGFAVDVAADPVRDRGPMARPW